MSIYSANRSGLMESGNIKLDNYKPMSFGRIMYESAKNDMAIFEAVLASDFKEMDAIREGTLLESELRSINEANVKDFLKAVKEKLMKVWAKLKAAIKATINKIAAYVLGDGKAYKKNFERTLKMYSGYEAASIKGQTIDYEIYEKLSRKNYEFVAKYMNSTDTLSRNDILNAAYKEVCGKDCTGFADFNNAIIDMAKTEVELKATDKAAIDKNLASICDGKRGIKSLKAESDRMDKVFKAEIRSLEKSISEDDENRQNKLNNINVAASAAEAFNVSRCKIAISLMKLNMKCSRKLLNALMREIKNVGTKNKNFVESAAVEDVSADDANAAEVEDAVANDEIDEVFDGPDDTADAPAEVQEEIEELVESCTL